MSSPSFTDLSSQYLALLASVSPVGIFHTDVEGRATYVDHRFTVIFGQAPYACAGFGWLDAIHVEDRPRLLDCCVSREGRDYSGNYRMVRPDGEIRHIQVRMAPLISANGERQGHLGSVEDVTDRHPAEAALRTLVHGREESQHRIQALFDNSLDAIVLADHDGRYVDANPAACALFGFSYDVLLTKSVADLVVLDRHLRFDDLWRRFLASGKQFGEQVVRRADGSTRAVEFRAVANVLPGTHLSILRDITDRKLSEHARQQYTKRLEILAAIDCAILAKSSPSTIADAAVAQISQLFPAVRVSVSLFDHARGRGWIAAVWSDRPTEVTCGRQFALSDAGPLLSEVRSIVVEDLRSAADRGTLDDILLAEGIRSYIRMPLCVQEEVIGSLNISSDVPGALSGAHFSVGQEVADRLAVALRHAQLFEDVQSSARQLSILSKRLVEVQERERRDFARELHDDVGQLLTALKLQLDELRGQAAATPPPALRKIERLTDDLVASVRRIGLNLRPPMLDEFGLRSALTAHIERFAVQTGIDVTFVAERLCAVRFPLEVETAIFRIVQEGLTNVARHAAVNVAHVELASIEGSLRVRIRDQGRGFDTTRWSPWGAGLIGMKERVELLGGTFAIASRPWEGTTITVTVPFTPAGPTS